MNIYLIKSLKGKSGMRLVKN